MSSLSKEQLRARLRLNHRLALSQSSDSRKPPPYFWRLRPIGSKQSTGTAESLEDSKTQTTFSGVDTNSNHSSELTFHSTRDREATIQETQDKFSGSNIETEASWRGPSFKVDVENVQENGNVDSHFEENNSSITGESERFCESRGNLGTLDVNTNRSKDKTLLEQELKRLQEVLSQKEEQIKQKDSEIAYLRQVLGEIATAAHLAVQLESSYSFPATYYSAEDVKLYKSADKVFYPGRRGFHSQPRAENETLYVSTQSESDLDAHDTRVSYSNESMKQPESISNHSLRERKLKLSLPVDSLGLSGPDTTSGRHKASSLTGDALSLQSIPSESDISQYDTQEPLSNDMVPPSPRISQLPMQEG